MSADPIGIDLEQSRTRILKAAEMYFRRIGYQKTSVEDIASELGMSRANVYRFFPSRTAINSSVCELIVRDVAQTALAIAQMVAPASDRLAELLNSIHWHSMTMLVKDRPMHELLVTAVNESWPIINAHNEQMLVILKTLVREGLEAGEFKVEDADDAAWGAITAFLPFFHPILLEQRVKDGEDAAAAVNAQIRFIMRALGKSENCPSSARPGGVNEFRPSQLVL